MYSLGVIHWDTLMSGIVIDSHSDVGDQVLTSEYVTLLQRS